MAKIGQALLLNMCNRNSIYNIPCRLRRTTSRKTVGSFVNEEEYTKHLERENQEKNAKKSRKLQKSAAIEKYAETKLSDENYTEDDWKSDIPKEILNLKFEKPNPAKIGSFSRMMLNMKSKAYRERHGSCMLEGKFLISDAMRSGMFVRLLYFSRLSNLDGLPVDILQKTNLVKVGFKEIQDASEVRVQSEGLIAVATKQDEMTRKKLRKYRNELAEQSNQEILPVTLICDNIRDAGNMGALLRTAAAVGCEQVITTKGCVDIWDSKVIRAGAGAHFKLPIVPGLSWDEISDLMDKNDVKNVYLTHPLSRTLKIPEILPSFSSRNACYKKLMSDIENLQGVQINEGEIVDMIGAVTMHSLPYYDVPFIDDGHTVIVLGSEISGATPEAYLYSIETSLKNDLKLKRLHNIIHIPMFFQAECLNTAVAGSVLLYEARRQMSD